MIIRTMLPGEADAVGDLRLRAYQAQDLLKADYADTLAALGRDGRGRILVAVEDGDLLGTVMYEPWHPGSEVARAADEAEVRAFAVAPRAQGRGIGRALMRAVIDQVTENGASRLVLSTQPAMTAAQNLYRSLGFAHAPELDWSPDGSGITLLAFALPLR